jgi:hypothetical protein
MTTEESQFAHFSLTFAPAARNRAHIRPLALARLRQRHSAPETACAKDARRTERRSRAPEKIEDPIMVLSIND